MRVSAIFTVLGTFCQVSATYLQGTRKIDKDDRIIYDKYIELDKNIKNIVNYGMKQALPFIMEANEHLKLSSNCTRNLFTLMSEIKKQKLSALKFIDAAGKLPEGIITGTFTMYGDYDECLSTKVARTDGSIAFQGQFCMLNVKMLLPKKKPNLTMNSGFEEFLEYTKNTSEVMQFLINKIRYFYAASMKYGFCVPTGCSESDVSAIINYIGQKALMQAKVLYCDQQHEFQADAGVIAAIVFFSLAGLLAVTGSSMDYYSRYKGVSFQNSFSRFLLCFSILTNFPKVISTKTQEAALTSVYGIRTLSLFYIILLHQYFCWSLFQPNGHGYYFEAQTSQFFTQAIFNGLLTTDVLFFLGGLVNIYSRIKMHEDNKRQTSVLQIILHRLWRIYPTYIFSLLIFFLLKNVYGNFGTLMKQELVKPCETKWWQNLLFINNFFGQDKMCMPHSWYVSADMHLFLLSLVTVPVLLKNERRGFILHAVVLMGGLVATSLWAWHKDLMPSVIFFKVDKEASNRLQYAYNTTLPHIGPYYTGLMTGYALSKWNRFKIPKICRILGWPTAAVCFISMLYMTYRWNAGADFTLLESALFFSFSRFLYVLAVAWMVLCCTRGYGGILNYILSVKIWIPLARISYTLYMVSLPLQLHYYFTLKMRIDVDWMTMIWRHIGDLGVSCLLSLVLCVLVESPFIAMEKLINSKSSRKKGRTESNVENVEKSTHDETVKEIELEKNEKNIKVLM